MTIVPQRSCNSRRLGRPSPLATHEARAAGADAVLLIAECLDDAALRTLHNLICELGMTTLLELYEAANLPRAIETGTRLLGIKTIAPQEENMLSYTAATIKNIDSVMLIE